MLKKGKFIKNRFHRMVVVAALSYAFLYASTFVDLSLAGLMFNESAVSAVELASPIITVSYAVSGFFVAGAVVVIGKEKGKFNDKKANKLYGQTLFVAILAGIFFSFVIYLGRNAFLGMYGCSNEVLKLSQAYCNWVVILPLVLCIRWVMMVVNETDADEKCCIISQAVSLFLNITLSILFARKMGVAGLSLGTDISIIAETVVLSCHLLKKTNTFKFDFQFKIKDIKETITYGAPEGIRFLFTTIVDVFINWFIVYRFGEEYLCTYAIIDLLSDVLDSFTCVPETGNAFGSILYGEKNYVGLKNIYALELRTSLLIGGLFTLITVCFSNQIPLIYGISSGVIHDFTAKSVMIVGGLSIFSSLIFILNQGFGLIDQLDTSLLATVLHALIMPLILPVTGAYIMGIDGFVWGIALNPMISFTICSIYMVIKHGFKGYPLYLKETDETVYTCDLMVNYDTIDDVCDFVENRLLVNDIERSLVLKIRLLCEELYTRIIESNIDKKITSECSLMIGPEYIRIIVRDDGEIKNYVDLNNKVESLNAYCLARLITNDINSNYSLTNSFNRNGFVFYRS